MGQNAKILIIITVAILAGVVIYIFTKEERPFETESWFESYAPTDKGPYGTYVFKELLDTTGIFESFIQIDGKLEDQLLDNKGENDIYFFIGKSNYMSESAFSDLLTFVGNGNTAFISAENMPDYLLDFFFLDMNDVYTTKRDSLQKVNLLTAPFSNKAYEFKYIRNNKTQKYNWICFTDDNIVHQSEPPKILGTNFYGEANFIKIPYDNGTFFFHTNPYHFTNISMFRFDGFDYAEDLIHHLPYGKIQWDIYNLNSHYIDSSGEGDKNSATSKRSIFEFIFQHQTLVWAFGLLMLTAILYAFFKGKRRQKVVEAVELKENSSLNYIETVSSLYLQERQHNKLVILQKRSFIAFIGNHYYIRSRHIDDRFISSVSLKSGIDSNKIRDIFTTFETLASQTTVSDQALIELQQKIEHFYKTCK